jgi:hypothetical protein
MPSQVNYMNPSAFMPQNDFKANGLLGGYLYGQQMDDYRQLMTDQFFMQELAKQRAAQEQAEFMEGVPLRQQKRTNEMEVLQGEAPFLRDAAGQRVQTEAAGNQFKRETEFSKGAQDQYFWKLRKEQDDHKWKQTQNELAFGAEVANTARQIADQQGELRAMDYVKQQIARGKQMGFSLPEQQLMDPQGRQAIYNAARSSIAQMQAIDLQAQKDTAAETRARIAAEATTTAAQTRASAVGANRLPRNDNEQLAQVRRVLSDPDASEEEKAQARSIGNMIANKMWNDYLNKNPALQADTFAARRDDERGRQARARVEAEQRRFIESISGGQTPSPTTSKPATQSGEKVKVKAPNGQEGYIPKSQLEAAKKQGYKELK